MKYSLLFLVALLGFSSCEKCTICTKTNERGLSFQYQEYCGNKKQVADYEKNLSATAEEKTTITCVASE